MSQVVSVSTEVFNLQIPENIIPFIEQITGLSGKDALQHFCSSAIDHGMNPQNVVNSLNEESSKFFFRSGAI